MYNPYNSGGIMKYILVIFIFGSFLFSQVPSGNYVNSVDNLEGLDSSGRQINSATNSIAIFNETEQLNNGALNYTKKVEWTKELDSSGRPINPK